MEVKKSDNSFEEFSYEKIKKGVCEAYKSSGEECPEVLIDAIIQNLHIYEKVTSSEIRRQVEEALMSINKKVARQYISKYKERENNDEVLKNKNDFIQNYINASNASTGSQYDANANVSHKNVVTLGQELYKVNNIKQNRYIMQQKISSLFTKKLAKQYVQDIEKHIIYKNDESALPGVPYCVSITMYPFLTDGLSKLGGVSIAPTDLKSFCGEFINLIYSVSSQFAGAMATPEFITYMDYFIRKDYGQDYLTKLDTQVEFNRKNRKLETVIENCFQQIVHSMNMPTGSCGYQAVFWNIGYFDKNYFEGIFNNFTFPDGTKPNWETVSWLQKKFMKWFNEERTKYVLTFPVETMAMLTDGKDVIDTEYADFSSEMWAEGHSFFCYLSDSPDSLASCCRLRNQISDNEEEHNKTTHQFSMGTASVATGSKSVMTINLNRVIQDAVLDYFEKEENTPLIKGENLFERKAKNKTLMYDYVKNHIIDITQRVQKYQAAFNHIIKDFFNANMLDVYSAGFIDMKKQYLTIGVNGLTDAAEFLGLEINVNDDYKEFVNLILETINICNKQAKTKELMYNTEFIPGENVSVKHYNWDKNDGYFVSPKHVMYSSYFFNPEDSDLNIIDKMILHGQEFVQYLDGGQALHANLKEHLSKEQYRNLLKIASQNGTNYFTFNVKNTECGDCGYISKHTLDKCPHCNSENIFYLTRIIGYLKRVDAFSEPRQVEESNRFYM